MQELTLINMDIKIYVKSYLINQFQKLNYGETRDTREVTELKEFTYWLFKLRINTKLKRKYDSII